MIVINKKTAGSWRTRGLESQYSTPDQRLGPSPAGSSRHHQKELKELSDRFTNFMVTRRLSKVRRVVNQNQFHISGIKFQSLIPLTE
jgi:hypothetical protein